MRALIVGAPGARGALAGARGLSAAGWTVGVGGPPPASLAAASRAARRWHPLPDAEGARAAFTDGVAGLVRAHRYEVVLAAGDAEMLALAESSAEIAAVIPHPPPAVVRRVLDKAALSRVASDCGLAVPRTWTSVAAAADAHAGAVVVKPQQPATGATTARVPARRAASPAAAAELVADVLASGASPLLQEAVDGNLMALTVVLDDARHVRAAVQQRADALWPADAGVSARAHTIALDARLLTSVSELLHRLGWVGLAQLQFLVPADGIPRLIDLNGRLYGSLALALAAGANLPAIWAASATGRDAGPASAEVGVRYQWFEGDLRNALARDDGRASAVVDTLTYALRARHSVWRVDDPLPAIRLLAGLPRRRRARASPRSAG